jgi:phospholipid/cholesterol/gamma-HCH transport system substrate-binding protein
MYPSKVSARNFLIGLVAVAMAAVLGYVALTANKGRLPGTPAVVVRAAFDDIGQLQVGAQVRQNGIGIGQVSAIDLVDGTPVVTMEVQDGVPMYRNGYAGIWDQSALQQKLVELRAGTPEAGLLGDQVLPTDRTESTHDLTDLLSVFDPATRDGLRTTMNQLGGGLFGYGPGLNQFVATLPDDVTNSGTLGATLASTRTDLPGLLTSADRLSERFTGRERQITQLLAQTDSTLRALEVDAGKPLSDTLQRLPTTLTAARAALHDAGPPVADVAAATGILRSGAEALGRSTPDLRGVFRESRKPLGTVPPVVDDAKPAVTELSDTLADARPFTQKTRDALTSLATPLGVFAPHGPDVNTFAFNASSALGAHDGWEHNLRAMIAVPGVASVLGNQIRDTIDPYPVPGEAYRQQDPSGGLIPGR